MSAVSKCLVNSAHRMQGGYSGINHLNVCWYMSEWVSEWVSESLNWPLHQSSTPWEWLLSPIYTQHTFNVDTNVPLFLVCFKNCLNLPSSVSNWRKVFGSVFHTWARLRENPISCALPHTVTRKQSKLGSQNLCIFSKPGCDIDFKFKRSKVWGHMARKCWVLKSEW